ncbi:MAG TPA: cupin domain-containing protein, partial [Chthonomonadaceae bacterium]|nr:cupin domain-containing protein [Chthonomonadaceae bacterium]
ADWTADFELQGGERASALAEAAAVIAGWGLIMPPGEPLVIHFGLHDFRRIGEVEYWIVNDRVNNYCGKFLFLFDGQRCPLHYHRIKVETFFVVRGRIALEVDGEPLVLREGDTYKMAPGRSHTFAAEAGPALVLEVSLPSLPGDNFFTDGRIGRAGVI